MDLGKNYQERVYAGVLGKIIGVYLGRPFEGWTYERIMEELGPVNYYVNEKLSVPLIVTDDDITGTFTFLRALKDFNYDVNLSAKQIGQTWQNNLIENETVLWWGGKGNSTEDTAFQNLKSGIEAPASGSIETNGKVVAEQIGAQIFIDGWPMVCPGDPEKAVDLAKKAASVSHDGEAIYGAQVIAALESQAFIEKDINKLIEVAKTFIPKDSIIYKSISDIQEWRAGNNDWEQVREKIAAKYGYDKYLGNCHMVPNHALIILSLLFGDDDFQKTLMIVNTAGWDTDCNSGNVGCLLGIKNGIEGILKGPDWLTPFKDIIYCPTAIGSQTMTDAVTESYKIIDIAKKIKGEKFVSPKEGARYNFEMPTSVQGWKADFSFNKNISTKITNVENKTSLGERSLQIEYENISTGVNSESFVDVFFPEELLKLTGVAKERFFHYNFISCPLLYSGQTIVSNLQTHQDNNLPVYVSLFVKIYGEEDKLFKISSEKYLLKKNDDQLIEWKIPETNSSPITQIGIEIESNELNSGKVLLNYLKITGEPHTTFTKPNFVKNYKRGLEYNQPTMWKKSWVKAVDRWDDRWQEPFKITNNIGRGLITTGTEDWKNYTITSKITFQLIKSGGLIARYQGLKRYYALELCSNNKLRLIKMKYDIEILKEIDFDIEFYKEYELSLKVEDNKLIGSVVGSALIEYIDQSNYFENGGMGYVVEDGTISSNSISIK